MIRLSRFKEFAVFSGGVFELHMMTHEEYLKNEDDSKEIVDKDVIAIQTRWRQIGLTVLGPKHVPVHSLSHFTKQFVDLQGIGPFDEQFSQKFCTKTTNQFREFYI